MTWDAAARAALAAKRDQLGWSNNEIEARIEARYGEHRPKGLSGSGVDRLLRGDGEMTVHKMQALATVLDVNLLDVLATITPGQAAEYRCILPSWSAVAFPQVRGLLAMDRRVASDRRHAV